MNWTAAIELFSLSNVIAGIIGFLGSLIVFTSKKGIGMLLEGKKQKHLDRRASDGILYKAFAEELPPDSGVIEHLRTWNDKYFPMDLSRALDRYLHSSTRPQKSYHDKKIEKHRIRFNQTLEEFYRNFNSTMHYSERVAGHLTAVSDETKGASPADYAALKSVGGLANPLIESYDTLVKVARERLNC